MDGIKKILNDLEQWAMSEKPLNNILFGVNQAAGAMKIRIFNSEAGAKDSDNTKVAKKYSAGYASYRKRNGRQTRVVDLEFSGSLRREIKVVRNGTKISIAVPSQEERKKIGYLEKQYKKEIFDLSESEVKEMEAVIKFNFQKDIEEILNGTA